jgi:D-proline reductase (dithiol) PrdB
VCNQSGGLIARVLEEHGISTVVVNQGLQQPERTKPPRTLFLKYPYGQPFGRPGDTDQQRVIVEDALALLATVTEPGTIVHSPYRWRREDFAAVRRERAAAALQRR